VLAGLVARKNACGLALQAESMCRVDCEQERLALGDIGAEPLAVEVDEPPSRSRATRYSRTSATANGEEAGSSARDNSRIYPFDRQSEGQRASMR